MDPRQIVMQCSVVEPCAETSVHAASLAQDECRIRRGVPRMDAIPDERPLDARRRTLPCQPSPQIPICKITELRIPTSCCSKCRWPDNDVGGTAGNEIPTRQCAREPFR